MLPGYAVCYDVAAPLTPAAGEFDENIRGRAVTKPATANLAHFAGIVTVPPQKRTGVASDNKGFCTIAPLKSGTWVNALVYKATTDTALSELLNVVDASFSLRIDASFANDTVAIVGEVKDCDPAANCLVMGLR